MGVAATQMERKGKRTIKGDTNREIKVINYKINVLLKKLEAIDNRLMQMRELSERDSLGLMLMRFHENGIEFSQVRGITLSTLSKASKLRDLSHLIAFVQGHNIRTLTELKEKNKQTSEALWLHKETMKKQQSRIKVLEELLRNYEYYKNNKAVYQEWQSITKPKKKDKFYNEHRGEITLFETAKKHFSKTLEDKKITPKAWRKELAELKQAHQNVLREIDRLAEDVASMETIACNIERLEKYENKQHEVQKKRTYELE
jgi:hypothetical protein